MEGYITRFNEDKKYGFILPLVDGPERPDTVFFHVSALIGGAKTASAGAKVSFRLVAGIRGVQAIDVAFEELDKRALTFSPFVALRGTVRGFDPERGFGFITPAPGQIEATTVFFHKSALKGAETAPIGCTVSFILVTRDNCREQAAEVVIQQAGSHPYGDNWEEIFHE